MDQPTNPAFGADEQDIVAALVPTGEAVEEILDLPAADNDQSNGNASSDAGTPAAQKEQGTEPTDAGAASRDSAKEPGASNGQPEQAATHQPSGDVRAALRAARAAERRLRDQLAAKDAELAALKEGKQPAQAELTDDELDQMRIDFPLQAKLVENQRALQAEIDRLRAQVAPPEWQPPSYPPEVQEHIDAVPTLLSWQHDPKAQDKFAAAIEHDKALEASPDWRSKPLAERFAEAARLAELQFTKTPTPQHKDPAEVIRSAPLDIPKGISDFRGGGPASAPAVDFSRMSDEAIMATLKPD